MELTSEYKCLSCSWSDHSPSISPREWLACPICGDTVVVIQRIPESPVFHESYLETDDLFAGKSR